MSQLMRQFFELNSTLVYFIYGQAFFVLGLAIALQSRKHSRLALSESLGWLAAFGITHGLYEWGHLFIPIYAQYVDPALLTFLVISQTILLALSFGFLFQFGAELLRGRWPWLTAVPLILTVTWGFLFVLPGVVLSDPVSTVPSSIWARYLLGFPGAMLVAWGLRHQAEQQMKTIPFVNIYRTLRLAGLAMAAYAVLGGLLVPSAPFFPASSFNQELLLTSVGVPVAVFRSLTGLVMTLAIIRALEVFDLEVDQRIEQLEMEQNLLAERERIARDLHDGNIQQVYTVGLMMEAAQRKLPDEPLIASKRLARAISTLNEVITSLRAYMNTLHAEPVASSLADGLRHVAVDECYSGLMHIELNLNLPIGIDLNGAQMAHILAIVKECLANAARHGHARHVEISALQDNGALQLTVRDDGHGFVHHVQREGYGLRNMQDRAHLIGGRLTISSEPQEGTAISLVVPQKES